MPSSMVGIPNISVSRMPSKFQYTQPVDSIKGVLESNNNKVKILNYNWSKGKAIKHESSNAKPDYIQKYTKNKNILNNTDVILYNPSKERTVEITANPHTENWKASPQNDNESRLGVDYKKLVLHFLNETKHAYSKGIWKDLIEKNKLKK